MNNEDIKLLASRVFHGGYAIDVEHGKNAYNECVYCGRYVYWDRPLNEIKHSETCLRLVAERVLRELGEDPQYPNWPNRNEDAEDE